MKIFLSIIIAISLAGCSTKEKERFVDVNGSKFHIKEYGKGNPTVIFENGIASPMDTWKSIPHSISNVSNVLTYDRAGIGKSDTTSTKRTLPNMVHELRQILKKEKLEPPYIYVAHSMGSYLARYYSIHYPNEISALLLIDPSPDKLYDNYTEQEYKDFKDQGDKSFSNSNIGEKREWESYLDNRKYVQNASISDNIPLVIISATQWDFYAYHSELMNNNENSKHLKVDGSHDIHQENPELIVDLINELIDKTE
jgi:pimeloyl-ACP methyl ester carboxylesterase